MSNGTFILCLGPPQFKILNKKSLFILILHFTLIKKWVTNYFKMCYQFFEMWYQFFKIVIPVFLKCKTCFFLDCDTRWWNEIPVFLKCDTVATHYSHLPHRNKQLGQSKTHPLPVEAVPEMVFNRPQRENFLTLNFWRKKYFLNFNSIQKSFKSNSL